MRKHFIFLFALAALLLFAGGRTAHALSTEPYVTWDPQSISYPVGADAEYSATVSGNNLQFTWYVEYGGKEYELPKQKTALMNAGMKSYCDDITVKSTANRTTVTFKNIKIGIDGWTGNWTRVYCHAFDGNTGADTSYAHVGCNGFGLTEAGLPPKIYIRPVISLQPDDVGKIYVDVLNVDYNYIKDLSFQWYTYSGGPYSTGIKAIVGDVGQIHISEAGPGEWEDLVAGVKVTLNTGSSYYCYSSPVSVVRQTGDIDYSWDQIRINRKPDRLGYTLGDKVDLTGIEVEYIANDKSYGTVPIASLETDVTSFTYAGPVWVTVGYKGLTNGFTVWVDPKNGDWELDPPKYLTAQTQNVRMSYAPGEKLDTSGLKVKVTLESGASYVESDLSKFDIQCEPFKEGGIYTVHIYMKGWSAQGNYLVSVIPPETAPAPTSEAPTTEAPTTEAPTTEEVPTQPDTAEAPSATETEKASTEEPAQPESTAAQTEAPATAAPVQTTEAAPNNGGSGGGNTVLIVLIIVLALIIGLLAGILMGKKKEK